MTTTISDSPPSVGVMEKNLDFLLDIRARLVIILKMIRSFADSDTEALWRRERVKRIGSRIQRTALRKLAMLNAAATIKDLRVPPGNRLEALKGKLSGRHSIRVNDQWRIVFRWRNGDAYDVSIMDYHN